MLRAVVAFIVVLVLVIVVVGLFGAVGPYELLLAFAIALVVSFVVARTRSRSHRSA